MNLMSVSSIAMAVVGNTEASDLVGRILRPEVLPFCVGVVAIVMGGVVAVVKLILRHRERMAKIEMGMDPDAPPTDNNLQGGR